MATADPQIVPAAPVTVPPAGYPEIKIISHSTFLYWWPVWAVGYLAALVIYFDGSQVNVNGDVGVWFPRAKTAGLIYTFVLFAVIVFTNMTLRGLSSWTFVLGVCFIVLLLAYLGWWEDILGLLPAASVYMNLGFYLLFSTMLLLTWLFAVFVYDRMTYWKVRPGQVTEEHLIGGAQKSYDTEGLLFEKMREDVFRHWILGLGSGDMRILTGGVRREDLQIPNVLFVDRKIAAIQRLIAMKPDQLNESPG